MPVFLSIALHQELVSQCLMVRDASVIRQNPEAAIASDGEEHVLMPQNPWKCGHQLEESGNRFRTKNIICPEWKKQYWLNEKNSIGKLKSVMHKQCSLVFWSPQMETGG